jgi:sulfur carrier protein ThiS
MSEQTSDKVLVTLRKERWQVEPGKTARQVMQELDLNPENYLTMINGQLVDDSTRLKPGDHLKLVAVISGGSHAS